MLKNRCLYMTFGRQKRENKHICKGHLRDFGYGQVVEVRKGWVFHFTDCQTFEFVLSN